MSEALAGERADAAARSAADWLSLAAAPMFAIMAMLTATDDGGPAGRLCGAVDRHLSPGGMTLMYVLMSIIHSAAWLKLISRRKAGRRRRGPAA